MVSQCVVCAEQAALRREPLMPTPLPDYPWQVVGSDLFTFKGDQYLVVVDFSRFPEVVKMPSTLSTRVIEVLKQMFARYGLPEVFRSDDGPQYSSEEFANLLKSLRICHVTSSPHYPQSNGQGERTVQTIKRLLKRSTSLSQALLSYRSTPLPWCNLSPAELLMGRRLRTLVPQTDSLLIPRWSFLPEFKTLIQDFKDRQKRDFDHRHRVKELPPIPDDQGVWISTRGESIPGTVISAAPKPRSYVVETPSGEVQRNRSQLRVVPDESQAQSSTMENESNRIMTRTRTGVELKPLA